jgi:hypothetical protein
VPTRTPGDHRVERARIAVPHLRAVAGDRGQLLRVLRDVVQLVGGARISL